MAVKPEGKGDYFDELETMTAEARVKYLNQKLSDTVDNAYRNALAIKKLFDNAGVKPSQVRTIKDLEKLPITRKNDIIEMQKVNPPYGGLSAIPAADIERVFISPGPIY